MLYAQNIQVILGIVWHGSQIIIFIMTLRGCQQIEFVYRLWLLRRTSPRLVDEIYLLTAPKCIIIHFNKNYEA